MGMSFIQSTYFNRAVVLLWYYVFSHYEVYHNSMDFNYWQGSLKMAVSHWNM